jgi:hypothetical protein
LKSASESCPEALLWRFVEKRISQSTNGWAIVQFRAVIPSKTMKYICLGYIDPKAFAHFSAAQQGAMMDSCIAYDDQLRANGHFKGGEALQPPNTAMTLRHASGRVVLMDGPFAETKEQLGGIMVLEARDLNHAVELISKHPGVHYGPWEIRPAADLSEMVRQSEARRHKAAGAP